MTDDIETQDEGTEAVPSDDEVVPEEPNTDVRNDEVEEETEE